MAERRMFAKTIIDSDAFLEMPLSTQCLYFHLSMRADDEGFINNPKKIARMIGAADDDIKVLIAKRFIIPFESGIVVIKHWKIHNYIRSDRITETKYQEERATLVLKDNGAYSLQEQPVGEIPAESGLSASELRKKAYKESELPYSFDYKIKQAFEGRICPICGVEMRRCDHFTQQSLQHNIPISKGGKHELGNISIICRHCNTSIRDNETEDLNNSDVVFAWDKINELEKAGVDWFKQPQIIWADKCQTYDGQMSDICPHRLGKDSSKDSIGYISYSSSYIPTLQEIEEEIRIKHYLVNASAFKEFYDLRQWCSKGKPIQDWRGILCMWDTRLRELKDKPKGYTGNDITQADLDSLLERYAEVI